MRDADLPPSDPMLRRAFTRWNPKFFGGELPEDVVLWFEPLENAHAEMGDGEEKRGMAHGLSRGAHDEFYIVIDPAGRYSRCRWGLDLFHELAHLHLYPYMGHGKPFQDEMLRLAQLGAFKGIW